MANNHAAAASRRTVRRKTVPPAKAGLRSDETMPVEENQSEQDPASDVEPLAQFFDPYDDSDVDPTYNPRQSEIEDEEIDVPLSGTDATDDDISVGKKRTRKEKKVARLLRTRKGAVAASRSFTAPSKLPSSRSTHLERHLARRPFANSTKHVELYRDGFQAASTLLENSHNLWHNGALRHAFQCMMDGDFLNALNLLQSFTVMFMRPGYAEYHSLTYIRLTVDVMIHMPDRNKDYEFLDTVLKTLSSFSYPMYDALQLHRVLVQLSKPRIRDYSATVGNTTVNNLFSDKLLGAAAIINEPLPTSHRLNNSWQHSNDLAKSAFILPTYYRSLRRAMLGLIQYQMLIKLFYADSDEVTAARSRLRVELPSQVALTSRTFNSYNVNIRTQHSIAAPPISLVKVLDQLGVRLRDAENEHEPNQFDVHESARRLLLSRAITNLKVPFEYCRNNKAPYLTLDVFIGPLVELLILQDIDYENWASVLKKHQKSPAAALRGGVFKNAEEFLNQTCRYNPYNCINPKRYLMEYYRWLGKVLRNGENASDERESDENHFRQDADEAFLSKQTIFLELANSLPESSYAFEFMKQNARIKHCFTESDCCVIAMLSRYVEYDKNRYSIAAFQLFVDLILHSSTFGDEQWRHAVLHALRNELGTSNRRRRRLWRTWLFDLPDLEKFSDVLMTISNDVDNGPDDENASLSFVRHLVQQVRDQNAGQKFLSLAINDDDEQQTAAGQLKYLLFLLLVTAVALYGIGDPLCEVFDANVQKCLTVLHNDAFYEKSVEEDAHGDDEEEFSRRRYRKRRRKFLRLPFQENVFQIHSVLVQRSVSYSLHAALDAADAVNKLLLANS